MHNNVQNAFTIRDTQQISFTIEYFQFGPRAGDATIPPLEEPTATNQSLTLSTPLVFYGNPLSTINVRIIILSLNLLINDIVDIFQILFCQRVY